MLKKFFLIVCLCRVIVTSSMAVAQSWQNTKCDTVWLPISSSEIKQQVRQNATDAVGLYQLWRRAQFQQQEQTFFSTLEQMQKEQPRNGVLLAVRCAMIEDSIMAKGYPQFKVAQKEWAPVQQRRVPLEVAKKMAPKLWLNYLTEAKLISWEQGSGIEPKVIRQQVSLCQKAVALAPALSFTNDALARYLSNLSRHTRQGDVEAIKYYRKAQQLVPGNCDPSFGLIFHYRYNKPNSVERKKAEQAVLATIPPGLKLSPRLRQFLAKQGISAPTG